MKHQNDYEITAYEDLLQMAIYFYKQDLAAYCKSINTEFNYSRSLALKNSGNNYTFELSLAFSMFCSPAILAYLEDYSNVTKSDLLFIKSLKRKDWKDNIDDEKRLRAIISNQTFKKIKKDIEDKKILKSNQTEHIKLLKIYVEEGIKQYLEFDGYYYDPEDLKDTIKKFKLTIDCFNRRIRLMDMWGQKKHEPLEVLIPQDMSLLEILFAAGRTSDLYSINLILNEREEYLVDKPIINGSITVFGEKNISSKYLSAKVILIRRLPAFARGKAINFLTNDTLFFEETKLAEKVASIRRQLNLERKSHIIYRTNLNSSTKTTDLGIENSGALTANVGTYRGTRKASDQPSNFWFILNDDATGTFIIDDELQVADFRSHPCRISLHGPDNGFLEVAVLDPETHKCLYKFTLRIQKFRHFYEKEIVFHQFFDRSLETREFINLFKVSSKTEVDESSLRGMSSEEEDDLHGQSDFEMFEEED